MSKEIKGNGKHLTISDRIYIEQELLQRSSFRSIAASLGKDPSNISKEIKLHRAVAPNGTYRYPSCYYCKDFKKCRDTQYFYVGCDRQLCWICDAGRKLSKDCKNYNPFSCPKLYKPPYVCNGV